MISYPTFLYLFLFIFEKLEGKEQNSINKEANFWKYKNKSLVNPKVEKEKLFLRYILPTATVKKRKEKEKAVGKEKLNLETIPGFTLESKI